MSAQELARVQRSLETLLEDITPEVIVDARVFAIAAIKHSYYAPPLEHAICQTLAQWALTTPETLN